MKFVENQWYGAIWSQDLSDEPVTRRILKQPIVLFRTRDGEIAALADVCPHRFAPLHLGKVIDKTTIRCGYHGLEFDRRGVCVKNPHNEGRIPPAAKVRRYPVMERHGMVWLWMGSKEPDPALIPNYSVLDHCDPKMMATREWLKMNANYMLIVNNLLDLSHVSILHEGLLGNEDSTKAEVIVEEPEGDLLVKRYVRNMAVPRLLDLLYKDDGGRVDHWSNIRLMGVSSLLNEVGVTEPGMGTNTGTGMWGVHILTPIDETSSLYHFCAVRVNPPIRSVEENLRIRKELSELRTMVFSTQDTPMIEAQQAILLDAAIDTSKPALFEIDVGATRFARRINKMIEADGLN